MEVSSVILKRAAQSLRVMSQSLHCCFDPMREQPISWASSMQVCGYSLQHIRVCYFITRPSPQDLDKSWWHGAMPCTDNFLWGRFAQCQPRSLKQPHLYPVARRSQDNWRWIWLQWMLQKPFGISSTRFHRPWLRQAEFSMLVNHRSGFDVGSCWLYRLTRDVEPGVRLRLPHK